MNVETLKKAIALGAKLGQVILATTDNNNFPHVATAGKISLTPDQRVAVAAWFCLDTLIP